MIRVVAVLFAALAWAPAVQAELHRFDFRIDEDQVRNNPGLPDGSTDSAATGWGHLVFDDVAGVLHYSVSWTELRHNLTALHIHGPAGPETSASDHLIELLDGEGEIGAAGLDPRSDVFTGSMALSTAAVEDRCEAGGVVDCLFAERAYVNVHSKAFVIGEIRGQVRNTPGTLRWNAAANEQQVKNSSIGDGSTDSAATGHTTLRFDLESETFSYESHWVDLTELPTQLHIHGPADPASSTPHHLLELFNSLDEVIDPTPADYAALQAIAGSLAGSALETECSASAPGALPCLIEERGYTNLHTRAWVTGEIRGKLALVPEPKLGCLRFAALCGLIALRRRAQPASRASATVCKTATEGSGTRSKCIS